MGPHLVVAKRNHLAGRVVAVDWRLRLHLQPEHRARLDRALVQEQIVAMQVHRHAERAFRGSDAGHVVDVRVGQQDMANRQRVRVDERQQAANLVARGRYRPPRACARSRR